MEKIITNNNFSEILESSKVVLVDFWAAWCGPCRMLTPVIDDIADAWSDRITVAKCNVDDADEIASQFRIMSIPTLLFFKDGAVVEKIVGLTSQEKIEAVLNTLV